MEKLTVSLMAAALWHSGAHAAYGYVTDPAGQVVRHAAGECWHARYWEPTMAVSGCDGVVEAIVPAVVVDPVAIVELDPVVPVIVIDPVYFPFDSADLSDQAVAKLDAVAGTIRSSAAAGQLVMSGHTDRIGTEQYDLRLSERRGEAVRHFLAPRIETAISVEVIGHGETQSVVTCPDVIGNELIRRVAPNRRVEIDAALTGGS